MYQHWFIGGDKRPVVRGRQQGNLDMGTRELTYLYNFSVNRKFEVLFFNKEEKECQVAFRISRRIRDQTWRNDAPVKSWSPEDTSAISEYKHSMPTTYLMVVTVFFFNLTKSCSMWDLNSANRNQTHAPCTGSRES